MSLSQSLPAYQPPVKKKKKGPSAQKLIAQSKLQEVMSKYTSSNGSAFSAPKGDALNVKISAASDSEDEGEGEGAGEETDLAMSLHKPIIIPATSGADLFAAYLKMA